MRLSEQFQNSCLYRCVVTHRRRKPVRNAFEYGIFMFYIDLEEARRYRREAGFWQRLLLNINGPGLFSFQDRDHFRFLNPSVQSEYSDVQPDNDSLPTRRALLDCMQAAGYDFRPGRIRLLTNLRVLGYAFNPVSFYFIEDEHNQPALLLAEVNNTFGEQMPYFIELRDATESKLSKKQNRSQHRDLIPENTTDRQSWHRHRTRKNFYVSPFLHHHLDFAFRFQVPRAKLDIIINTMRDRETVLFASLNGRRAELSASNLWRFFISFPLVTLKVIIAIHYQALKLFLKRVPHYGKQWSDRELGRRKSATNSTGEQAA
ncbi:MAG: DUF1365 domain-containing protein [Leptospiraceae bacterium]|nr:DUF1365 domain-containing protein [Leptospiraceae bacterium]MCB1314571.1 DUF1365 domain-containing protein [Leptospiraceae bacterium]